MKKSISILTIFISSILIAPNAVAASSEVTWTDYEKYRDIREGNENRKSFRERTFKSFEKHFILLASSLPEKQVLKIDVTDVDLAGDVNIGGINQVRVVKQIYSPRMTFSYQLLDESGKVIQEENVELRDMNFMSGSNSKYRNQSLGYEKRMLDKWFKEALSELIVEKK